MTSYERPTMTHVLSAAERNALMKAIAGNDAAKVVRIAHGVYQVPSATQPGTVYTVTGIRLDGADFRCSCPAGARRLPCRHQAALRLRKVQEAAKAQARKLAQAPAVTMPAARHPYPSRRQVELV
jgi:hypothetical protein